MAETYARFRAYRTCDKCGTDHRKVEFHAKHPHMLYMGSMGIDGADQGCMTLTFDHMAVTCERCRYGVIELPLDAE